MDKISFKMRNTDKQLGEFEKFVDHQSDISDSVLLIPETLNDIPHQKEFDELHRPLLKIINPANGKCIYRKFRQGSRYHLYKNQIALSSSDFNSLRAHPGDNLQISPIGRFGVFKYYYYNPILEIRLATRAAVWAIPVAFIFDKTAQFLLEILFNHIKSIL